MTIGLRGALDVAAGTWAICSLAACMGLPALADVHYAGAPWPGGDPPYDTPENAACRISDAMDVSQDGHTVICLPGTFSAGFVVKEGVKLIGMGPECCLILGGRLTGLDLEMEPGSSLTGFRLVDCALAAWDWGSALVSGCVFDGSSMSCRGQVTIHGCRFEGLWGGWPAYLTATGGQLLVSGCRFAGGTGSRVRGIDALDGVTLSVKRSSFFGCETAIDLSDACGRIRHCVFVDNRLAVETGLLDVRAEHCTFYRNDWAITSAPREYPQTFISCIMWASREGCVLEEQKWYPLDIYLPVITFSDVEGGYPGRGNIDEDPMFFLPSADDPDLHLCAFSPCVDAGDPFSDYSQEPEPNGGRVNMGAYGNTWEAATSELADADGDNMRDDWEIETFGNLDQDGSGDADDDGLNDREEYRHLSDPNNPDSDGDGLPDAEEAVDLGTDPIVADTDNDGTPDGKEVSQGTDPLGPWDAFTIIKFWIEDDQIHVVHPVQPRCWYQLQSSFFPNGPFGTLVGMWAGRQGVITHAFVGNINPHTRFFRVEASPY